MVSARTSPCWPIVDAVRCSSKRGGQSGGMVSDRKACHASSEGLPCVVVEFKADSGNVSNAHAADVDWQGGAVGRGTDERPAGNLGAAETERP